MNFIQLVDRLSMECGEAGNGPLTVVGQTGMAGNLVNWINMAWTDIQSARQDWDFLRRFAYCTTVAGQPSYTPNGTVGFNLPDFGRWDIQTFRNFNTSIGVTSEIFMDYMDYQAWWNTYNFNATRNVQTRPIAFAIGANKAILLGPIPADGYTVTGQYFAVPSSLAADTDTPSMPSQFHMGVVYKAMMYYGLFHAATEVYDRGDAEFSKIMSRLAADHLPTASFAGTLA